MTTNPAYLDDTPPPTATVVRVLAWLTVALATYTMLAIFNDPLPYPAQEVACGAVIALVLAGDAWRWVRWSRSKSARPSLARQTITTTLVLLFAYAIFREVYFDPLPRTFGSILALSFFPLVLGMITSSVARTRDEVERAAAFEGFAWGALVGLGLIYAAIVALRFSPGLSDWLQAVLAGTPGPLSPAALGFAWGAAYSLVVVWMSLIFSRALWWVRKR